MGLDGIGVELKGFYEEKNDCEEIYIDNEPELSEFVNENVVNRLNHPRFYDKFGVKEFEPVLLSGLGTTQISLEIAIKLGKKYLLKDSDELKAGFYRIRNKIFLIANTRSSSYRGDNFGIKTHFALKTKGVEWVKNAIKRYPCDEDINFDEILQKFEGKRPMQINQILLKARKMAASQKLEKLSQNIIETALGKVNTELLPNENFTLVGQSELEKFFNEKIIDVLRYPERYARFGITAPGSTLLHGKPGVGKTYAIK